MNQTIRERDAEARDSISINRVDFYRETYLTYKDSRFVAEYARRLCPERKPPVREAVDRLIEMVGPGARILDVGCGTGKDVAYLRTRRIQSFGVDFSDEMVRWACNSIGNYFLCVDIRKPQSNTLIDFDGILSLAVIQHIAREGLGNALRNMRAAIKDNGVLLLMTKEGRGEYWDTRFGARYRRATALYLKEDLEDGLIEAGFSVESCRRFTMVREGLGDDWITVFARARDHDD